MEQVQKNTQSLSHLDVEEVTIHNSNFMNLYKNAPANVLNYLNRTLTEFVEDASENLGYKI